MKKMLATIVCFGVGMDMCAAERETKAGADSKNLAYGKNALASLDSSNSGNTAFGNLAGGNLVKDSSNNALFGDLALSAAIRGQNNVVIGAGALGKAKFATDNVIIGVGAVGSADAFGSLSHPAFLSDTVAIGRGAFATLVAEGGDNNNNIGIGANVGFNLTQGHNNLYIGVTEVKTKESNTTRIGEDKEACYISGIHGKKTGKAAMVVVIDAEGKLGTMTKEEFMKQ